MVTGTDIAVWTVSTLLAVGVGWSRYTRWKTRNKLVRDLVAMTPEQRNKFLMRLDPKLAQDLREQLLARFRIMT